MKLLTKEQQESYKNAQICYICKEKIKIKYLKVKSIINLLGGAAHSMYNLKCNAPKKLCSFS